MELALPKNKWTFILIVNLVWWSVPFGMIYDMSANPQHWSNPAQTDGDSLGIVVVPVFAVWLIFSVALNILLFLKRKSYPAGAALFAWNPAKKMSSAIWSVVCACFVSLYLYAVGRTLVEDIYHDSLTLWVYASMLGFIFCSLWMQTFLVAVPRLDSDPN